MQELAIAMNHMKNCVCGYQPTVRLEKVANPIGEGFFWRFEISCPEIGDCPKCVSMIGKEEGFSDKTSELAALDVLIREVTIKWNERIEKLSKGDEVTKKEKLKISIEDRLKNQKDSLHARIFDYIKLIEEEFRVIFKTVKRPDNS